MRVGLHGRRVRGWVVADHVVSDVAPKKLRSLLAVSSAGPPGPVIELAELVAHRYAGPLAAVLRSASPQNNVAPASIRQSSAIAALQFDAPSDDVERAADEIVNRVGDIGLSVLRWPPRFDRRRLVARLIASNGSTIVLTADGTRAKAFALWLAAQGIRVALMHSDETRAALTDAWRIAAGGECVVVGGRMATFAPVPDLRRAIVLDDSDEALQEERTPTWHARDVLLERADSCGALAVVVSPSPTATAVFRSDAVLGVAPAIEAEGWPRVEVIDMRETDPTAGNVSDELVDAVRGCLSRNELAVLVLNRRGGVRLLRCAACHSLTRWDANGKPLWDHDTPEDIEIRPTFCVHCGGAKLKVLSAGVQRVASHLSLRLGGAEVSSVDAAVSDVGAAAVVVGTEAVLHRREIRLRRPSLVAFIDFDSELYAARYRANEQALWLVVRAAHMLSGRPRTASRVLIQTHDPDHEVVRVAGGGNHSEFVATELARRRLYGLPPFAAIAEVRGEASAINECALQLAAISITDTELRFDRDAERLLVHACDAVHLAAALSISVAAGRAIGKLRVTVDPPRL